MQVLGRTEDLYNKGIRTLQFLIGENGWEIDDFQTSLSRSLSEDKSEVSDETKLWFSSEDEMVDEMVGTEVGVNRLTSASLTSWGAAW